MRFGSGARPSAIWSWKTEEMVGEREVEGREREGGGGRRSLIESNRHHLAGGEKPFLNQFCTPCTATSLDLVSSRGCDLLLVLNFLHSPSHVSFFFFGGVVEYLDVMHTPVPQGLLLVIVNV